ncbi:cellulose binding domain-containing protein [Catellatospora bangladeshensis]|uniref:CBM2 domain-containing protein n=1 Tax=Catellatospora bangladeshensis TaxID=310355 RepID=A0A8J3JG52_9ACTN|nr:cellulose binding domain-containing protein [Catellatospora bangladeshensis]GIF79882.1 hypothetical protein Cba03nite_12310 [Catellatospora bangladeshensis]
MTYPFPASGLAVTSGHSATWTQSGANVTAVALSWNANLAPGASATIGYNGAWTTTNPEPTAFKLNGSTCTVSQERKGTFLTLCV